MKPPKRIRGREDVKYSREPNLALNLITQGFCRVTFGIKTKHVRQGYID